MPARYDALLLVSFGGPERMDDVMPFLENVVRGKDVPPERLRAVAGQYEALGGRSPLPDQCRALIRAVEDLLGRAGPPLPVYWGNRNWHPLLADTLARMAADGVSRALALLTSAYGSYPGWPRVDKLRAFYNHPGFVEPLVERVKAAFDRMPHERRDDARLVFTAHSLPLAMARVSGYEAELRETAALVAAPLGRRYALAFQSRSGRPGQPWLEPDVLDELGALAAQGARDVVVAPIGFLSDHMEVVYDLDVQARARASELGLGMIRAQTVGADPRFVAMVRELVLERMEDAPPRFLGTRGPSPHACPEGCCVVSRGDA